MSLSSFNGNQESNWTPDVSGKLKSGDLNGTEKLR